MPKYQQYRQSIKLRNDPNLIPFSSMNRPQSWIIPPLALIYGLCLLLRSSAAAPGRTAEASVEPAESDNFYEAKSRFWVAAGSSELRGVLVLLPGTDSDARGKVSDPFWQTLAQRERLGLLGVYLRGEGEPYESAAGGSGAALLRMIEQVAVATGLAHIARAPLLLVGHSSGAMFAFNFAGWAPPRVAAFVAVKTGPIAVNSDPRIAAIPTLFIVGEHDLDARVQAAAKVFAGAGHPAAWALAVERQAGHDWTPADNALIAIYFHALLSTPVLPGARVERPFGSPPAAGCLRNLAAPFAANSSTRASADTVWLPDETSANAWAQFTQPARIAALTTQVTTAEPAELQIEPATLNLEPNALTSIAPDEMQGSVVIQVQHANSSRCTFHSTDPRLTITASALEPDRYRLDLRLRTAGLAGGLYRTTVNVVAYDQKNAHCESAVSLLARVPSAVRTMPASLYVGVIDRGEIREQTVTIPSGSIQVPWKIRSIKSSNPAFATAAPGALQPEGATLVCHFDAAKVVGNQSGHFDLVLEDGASGINLTLPFIAFVSKRTARRVGDAIPGQHP